MTTAPPPTPEKALPLKRLLAGKRLAARAVLLAEAVAPRLLLPISILLLFAATAWFGLFRLAPFWLHVATLSLFVIAFLASLVPLARLRLAAPEAADRMLEARNGLRHQAIRIQNETVSTGGPAADALWREHQARMARTIGTLSAGAPQPDLPRHDPFALRAAPVLIAALAFAYSYSNRAGFLSDAFHLPEPAVVKPDLRIDAWVTPPAYTGKAPLFLTGEQAGPTPAPEGQALLTVPQFSEATVRLSGGGSAPVSFEPEAGGPAIAIAAEGSAEKDGEAAGTQTPTPAAPPVQEAAATPSATGAQTHLFKIDQAGTLVVGDERWRFAITPDTAPDIAFDGQPKTTVAAALEIGFLGKDDYGITEAWAEIVPIETQAANARPLYPAPEYRLDLPRRNTKDIKGLTSRNLSEHPLSGKPVRITLVAKDAAGQEGRSQPQEMILPAKRFFEPLAGAIAEQRQIFALDANKVPRALELNDALAIRADETIPNVTHFLAMRSARNRLALAYNDDMLREAADYFWEVALGIEDGNLSLAERRLRDAQQALQDALQNNASDAEIARLMQELREAMQEFMQALAEQAAKNPQSAMNNPQMNNMLRQQDLERMMDQIENLARSGARDQAQQMLSELQRMMNNLQAGRPQQGQQGEQNNAMREQMDKLGRLMQEQQRLMDETFRMDQALRDRQQRGDPLEGENEELFGQEPPDPQPGDNGQQQQGENGEQQNPLDNMTAEQLREALKQLRAQQEGLGKQLGELQKSLEGMGMQPGEGFGKAQSEMGSAADALGRSRGEQALGSQGRAMEALRQGAQDMMNQMQAQQGQGQGQGQGMPQMGRNGRDPLGREPQGRGPDFGEQVKVPDEIDTQRAREILEEIRRKLGDNASPELERQYLERLLDIR
ncbi:TIGR02302 family protein [Rhizobium sp. RU20A]|uniref:TIGR02302 family protein n=1 Tax=Rhizobium sp. RU20A TaxID=1907412 RepID=UPI0009571CF1|nr:TIGR02302 family protein [Rhizobium sp. RU20A]SIQ35022.1 TIGR02302 family protein [Rhizobium sp. RU20A]